MRGPINNQAKDRKTRILIVDDHPLVRESLARIVQREPDLAVCGEAEDRNQALKILAQVEPHLVMVDLTLKNSSGLELVKDICHSHPKVRVLVLSMHDEAYMAERLVRAGASGYITKQETPTKILQAIRHVLDGEIYWSEKAAACVASRIARAHRGEGCLPLNLLTDREIQVLELIGTGRSTRQIAATLQISVSTIETYRGRIKEKLNLRSAAELLQCAICLSNERRF